MGHETHFTIEEQNVLTNVAVEMRKATDKDTVQKIYRQARNWARYHCYYGAGCSPEICSELNQHFKLFKTYALKELEEI